MIHTNHIKAFFHVCVVCLFLLSCTKTLSLSLSDNDITFTSVGGKQEIAVIANRAWIVWYEANWLDAKTRGNSGNGTIIVDVQPNILTTERSVKIFVTALSGDVIEEITISQKGHPNPLLQVYERDGTPITEDFDLVGKPYFSYASFDQQEGFSRSTSISEFPWVIRGEVKGGIIAIDFTDGKYDLPSADGWSMLLVVIEIEDNPFRSIDLNKIGDDGFSSMVNIYYASDDLPGEQVTFKSGWNFVEYYLNPNLFNKDNEPVVPTGPLFLMGTISQNVNDFLEKGYRWRIGTLIGPIN